MDPRLLDYYDRELRHLAGMCGEFARAYPKIAGRLSLEGFIKEFQCPDPYVERLLEGFAYMAARVKLKVDAEYPRFTQALLDMVYPDYLAPVPSMGIAQFQPDLRQGSLNAGIEIARGTVMRSLLGKGDQTACEYCTAHAVTLWPLTIAAADYLPSPAALGAIGVPPMPRAKAALRLRLNSTAGAPLSALPLDSLVLHICGNDQAAMRLYEQLHANAVAILCRQGGAEEAWRREPEAAVGAVGFDDDEALLPGSPRSFQGYRLLKEYFAFPPRFMFFELSGLRRAFQRTSADEIEILVVFDAALALLQEAIDASRLALFCTPVVNLFSKRTDRIHLTDAGNEFHIVVDRSRPMDYEVYAVSSVQGFGAGIEPEVEFLPFYSCTQPLMRGREAAYYTLFRTPRVLSSRQAARGPRSSYIGSEVFLALGDAGEAPYASSLRQVGITALCTNRDLPLQMPVGRNRTDLTWDIAAPLTSIRFLAGPTEPRPVTAHKDVAWKLISHLSLNYLSLTDAGSEEGAAALRELLTLYASLGDPGVGPQVEGLRSVAAETVARRLPIPGPVSFGRGLQISLVFDEAPFAGTGVFLLASVLENFFARYVTINAFTECSLKSLSRGEIKTWPPRIGRRYLA
jgi:type VI secretion system protein ImpG